MILGGDAGESVLLRHHTIIYVPIEMMKPMMPMINGQLCRWISPAHGCDPKRQSYVACQNFSPVLSECSELSNATIHENYAHQMLLTCRNLYAE